MSRKNTLPVHLPAALQMPFSAPGRADALLLRPRRISAAELPTLCKPWRKALQDGVAAAVAHDHDLFAHIPDAHDPDSLRGDYTDSPLVSPWIARNVERQWPSDSSVSEAGLNEAQTCLQNRFRTSGETRLPGAQVAAARAADGRAVQAGSAISAAIAAPSAKSSSAPNA